MWELVAQLQVVGGLFPSTGDLILRQCQTSRQAEEGSDATEFPVGWDERDAKV